MIPIDPKPSCEDDRIAWKNVDIGTTFLIYYANSYNFNSWILKFDWMRCFCCFAEIGILYFLSMLFTILKMISKRLINMTWHFQISRRTFINVRSRWDSSIVLSSYSNIIFVLYPIVSKIFFLTCLINGSFHVNDYNSQPEMLLEFPSS